MLLVWFGEQLSVPNYSPNQVKKTKSFEDRNLSYLIYNYISFEKYEPEGRLFDWWGEIFLLGFAYSSLMLR